MSAADGLLLGEAIAFGLLAVTAWQIYRNWDELWRDAEQILVGQEPEPQLIQRNIKLSKVSEARSQISF